MKIVVDRDLCQSHGVCVREAETVFELDPATDELVIKDESPDQSLRNQVDMAVQFCPNQALSIEE